MTLLFKLLPVASIALSCLLPMQLASAEEATPVMISKGVSSVDVKHADKKVKLTRVQEKENEIIEFYRSTTRGSIQPMHPFEPHQVETIGEREVIDYIKKKSEGDKSILVVDSRTSTWVERSGLIPSAINIPYKKFEDDDDTLEIMEDQFGVLIGDVYNFSNAKTLIMYCNGAWCGQSPVAIRKLLSIGYPAAKIKYYRGGMQSWAGLGLTVIDVD